MSNSVENSTTAVAASDCEIDENDIRDMKVDLESVYIYLMEGKYQEGMSEEGNMKENKLFCIAMATLF